MSLECVDILENETRKEPIRLDFDSRPFSQIKIALGKNASATVFETHGGGSALGEGKRDVEISLAEGARLNYVTLCEAKEQPLFVSHQVHQQKNSLFQAHTFSLGSGEITFSERVSLDAVGGEANLSGLYFGRGHAKLKHHVSIEHLHPQGTSRTFYKGVLGDSALGVFDGKVTVHPQAQKTNASQTNRNLLLSPNAEARPNPTLEIYADDVKCSHGATVGELDKEALFYLRSRGISEDESRELLVFAFAHEMVDRIEDPTIRAYIEDILKRTFL